MNKEANEVCGWIVMVRTLGWFYCDDLPRIDQLFKESGVR